MPVIIDGTNGITQAGEFNSDSSFGFKNRIINGAMVIDQRNAGASVASNNNTIFPVDRFSYFTNGSATGTMQQSSTVPTGFSTSMLYTITSGSASGSTTRAQLIQKIEGYNFADLGWGTATAKTITLSFWVRSSLTGTFGGSLQNNAQDRSYPYTYTISTANTWEYKTVTVAGDTSGTWNSTNDSGVLVYWDMGCGSSIQSTAGAWTAGDFRGATGTTSVVATTGATWAFTGVQLEVGSTATSFDYRPYTTELQLCQRYFQTYGYGANGTTGDSCIGSGMFYTASELLMTAQFLVIMRAVPTYSCATVTNGFRYHRAGAATNFDTVAYFGSTSTSAAIIGSLSVPVSGTAGYATQVYAQASGAKINFSAEL